MSFLCLKILPGSLPPSVSQILFQLPLQTLSPFRLLVFCLLVKPLGLFPHRYIVSSIPPTPTPLSVCPRLPAQGPCPWQHPVPQGSTDSPRSMACVVFSTPLYSFVAFILLFYFPSWYLVYLFILLASCREWFCALPHSSHSSHMAMST